MKYICCLFRTVLLISALILAGSGCSSTPKTSGLNFPSASALNTAVDQGEAHKIAPLEIIIVDVLGEKDFANNEYRVQANGRITFPYLEEIEVAGKTPSEVETMIETQLMTKETKKGVGFFVDPQVTVRVKEYRLSTVNVTGEVNKPGAIVLPGEFKWNIVDAISQAGGLTRGAAKTKIDFTRKGVTKRLSYDKLNKTTDPKDVIYLEPGDNILVNQSVW